MSNIDPVKIKQVLIDKNARELELAEEYHKACGEYGLLYSEWQQLLANRIMVYKAKKKNIGLEMAILFGLADNEWDKRDRFNFVNEKINELKYIRKGMLRVIETIASEKMTMQSLMKHDYNGERGY